MLASGAAVAGASDGAAKVRHRVKIPGAARAANNPYRSGVVLVGFRPGVPARSRRALEQLVGARTATPLAISSRSTGRARRLGARLGSMYELRVAGNRVGSAIRELRSFSRAVRFAEPDYLLRASGAQNVPNDPSFPLQWAALNSGQAVNGVTGTAGADEKAAAAWATTTGSSSVVIGEVDTGIEYTHPDLAANIWSNPGGIGGCAAGTHGYNIVSSTCNPMDDDTQYGGHGTHVAGIMGAVGNNAIGVAGVNWKTTILPVKWLNSNAQGTTSQLISALDWLVKAKQAGVNVRVAEDPSTFYGTAFSQALSDEIDLLGSNGILFVTAAGNTGDNNDSPTVGRYPCRYDRATEICVTATDQNDQLPSWANYGPNTVDMGAPGNNIYSTLRGASYGYINGGSMASAQVAGAAALILSTGDMSPTALKADILNSVDPLPSLSGKVITGGRLDVCKAITACANPAPVNTTPPTISGTAQSGLPLTASNGTWSNNPTSFTYAWKRCDSNGANCGDISGATSSSYTATPADVGSTLRVAVTASNTGGSSAPAVSSQTSVVAAYAQAPQGSWVGAYGSQGYAIGGWTGSGDLAYMPGVALSVVRGSRWVWSGGTSDVRALQGPDGSSRRATTWYDGTGIRLTLTFNAAYAGNLRLYAVDWDARSRRESITVGGQTVNLASDFTQGAWVVFPLNVAAGGSVTITVDSTTVASNAVLSGIFLGDAGPPPVNPVSTAPEGSWVGTYGSGGYELGGWGGSADVGYLPAASLSVDRASRYVWNAGTSDVRALQSPDGSTRRAATWYDGTEIRLTLTFSAAYAGNLRLYAVDWDARSRRETITVNGQSALLNSDFTQGAWVDFPVSVGAGASVSITIDRDAGSNAVLSGVFLGDAGPPPASPTSTAPQGSWVGSYGAGGYALGAWNGSSDLINLPHETLTVDRASRYVWSGATSDVRALQSPDGSTRRAATWYDGTEIRLTLTFSAAYAGNLRLYAVDWDARSRRETITVNGQSAFISSDFTQGAWVSFPLSVGAGATVTITVDPTGSSNAVLSGLFLD